MKLRTIGIDLGKTSFHLIGMDERGDVLLRRRFSRTQLITYISKLDTCLIGMEACSGSNILGRTLRAQGHTVRLMPPHVTHQGVHDHGFNNISTFGNLLRLMNEGRIAHDAWERRYCELALKCSGAVQAMRWSPIAGGGASAIGASGSPLHGAARILDRRSSPAARNSLTTTTAAAISTMPTSP